MSELTIEQTIEQTAAQLLSAAITAGRLPARPDPAALARISAIVSSALTATGSRQKKIATASTSVAIREEVTVAAATSD